MEQEQLEHLIMESALTIVCPACKVPISFGSQDDEPNKDEKIDLPDEPIECKEFRLAVDRKLHEARSRKIALSDFQMWCQQHSK